MHPLSVKTIRYFLYHFVTNMFHHVFTKFIGSIIVNTRQ